ncbi:MAG: hypothetical protein SFZ23_00195 [Planctomycetota bacterium]|nr:hypothetical protein [Planctomycetota bacterium]
MPRPANHDDDQDGHEDHDGDAAHDPLAPHDAQGESPADRSLTWALLLSKWSELAQRSFALPRSAEGDRWKAAVPEIIALQSVFYTLKEIVELGGEFERRERAVAGDKAGLLIREHASRLHTIWKGQEFPLQVREIIDDTRDTLSLLRASGVEWVVESERLVAEHPAELIAQLVSLGFEGDLYVPAPGVPLFAQCPAAFMRDVMGGAPAKELLELVQEFLERPAGNPSRSEPNQVEAYETTGMQQVYRQFDFLKGRPVRDFVVPMEAELPGGQPLLVPAILRGVSQSVSLPPKHVDQPPLPVEFFEQDNQD